jgi:hypothetical protein
MIPSISHTDIFLNKVSIQTHIEHLKVAFKTEEKLSNVITGEAITYEFK